MPVEHVPGFWDYLGSGVQKGIEYSREDALRKQQQDQANASLASQLFGAGAIDSTSLQGALKPTGIVAPVMPGKAERRKTALETPGAILDMSDEQRRELGFQTRTEAKQDQAVGTQADFATKRAQAMIDFASGGELTDAQSELTGFKNKKDRELERLGRMDPVLEHTGERFVAGAINQNPTGKIAAGQAKAISEKAYSDYVANRAQSGLGGLTPEEVQYTRSYFDRATQNAIIAQTKLDIAEEEAQAAGTRASNAGRGTGANQGLQWFKALSTAEDNVRKQMADILRTSPFILNARNDPRMAAMPMIAGPLAQYNELERKAEAYRQAQANVGDGTPPANMNELLGQAQKDAAGPTPPAGGAPVGGASQVAPAQGGAPAAGGARVGTAKPAAAAPAAQAPSDVPDDQINAAASILKANPGAIGALQDRVARGQLSRAAYEKIVQRAQQR